MTVPRHAFAGGRSVSASVAAGAALAASLLIAALLVRSRSLAEEARPEGWRIAFQPPKNWSVLFTPDATRPLIITYSPQDGGRSSRRLSMSRHLLGEPVGVQRFLAPYATLFLFGGAAVLPERAALGPLPGRRLVSISRGLYVHAGQFSLDRTRSEVYLLEYRASRPLTGEDLALCEAVVRSVRLSE